MSATIGGGEPVRPAHIKVHEFWRQYDGAPGGEQRESHWVRWSKAGDFHYNVQEENVARIRKPIRSEFGAEEYSPLWGAIKPFYDAWLANQEAPVFGTPLDAWSALNKRQVKALQEAGLRSVEEVAAIPDNEIPRVRIPDVRRIRNLARAFEANKEGDEKLQALLGERDTKLEQQEATLREQAELIAQMSETLKAMQAQQKAA